QVQNAANSVTSARDGYNSQAANRPATIQMEQSQIAAAQAQVDTAQSNLDGATLTAPVDGIITAVNAQAGDSIAANSGSSGAEAPGSTALLPSSGTGTGSGGAGGGSAFMTLVSTANYQTVVTFAESDAAKVAAGQVGQVTFDAISGLTVPVHVLAVAGSATVVSNVVNYYVTLSLDSTDPRLRPGMTTNATLITAEADNVLTVQNSALIHRGTQVFVNLLEGTKQVLTAVTVGVVGTTTTEVMTGVREGDTVVIPTVSATRSTTTLGGGGGRFGGGGAGVGVGLGG
ncbi:MAG TPA: HlyD family efflux transporter periplasmic adaptor subunit, partial [Candidatus Dormibacteraeota bacterium]|nr:HlyD family efflux transporter periplasmic adaptor subunit [Candidatus Dormibacteraeota bacterium]